MRFRWNGAQGGKEDFERGCLLGVLCGFLEVTTGHSRGRMKDEG